MDTAIDFLSGKWAISSDKLSEIKALYAQFMRGEVDAALVAKYEAHMAAMPMKSKDMPMYDNQDGIAVINLSGILSKQANDFMSWLMGGTSTVRFSQAVNAALADPAVKSIAVMVNSPGGRVDGTTEAATTLLDARGKKPTMAIIDGCGASAAYWIASAADKVVMSSPTSVAGSIGVIQTHYDYSQADAQDGIKVTEITAGKYKAVGSPNKPLSQDDLKVMQGEVDYLYALFTQSIAIHMGVDEETVLNKMADGKVFIGQQAVDNGLAHAIMPVSQAIDSLNQPTGSNVFQAQSGTSVQTSKTTTEETPMNREELLAKHPELAAALIEEGKKAGIEEGKKQSDAALAEASAKGATAERERIQSVLANSMPGHVELVQKLAFDGKTSGPEAAVQILQAEKAKLGKTHAALVLDANDAVVNNTNTAGASLKKDVKQAAEADNKDVSKLTGNEEEVAKRAAAYVKEQQAKGNKVSTAEAVSHITKLMQQEG